MPTITIPVFAGEVPRSEPRALDIPQAREAVNCDLARGSLRPLRGPLRVATASSPGTIFKHDTDGWLMWANAVNVIKSAVIDVIGDTPLGHLLITGDRGYPTQRFTGGQTYRLGIPRPDTTPIIKVMVGAGIGPVTVFGFGAADGGDMPTKDTKDGLAPVVGQGIGVTP